MTSFHQRVLVLGLAVVLSGADDRSPSAIEAAEVVEKMVVRRDPIRDCVALPEDTAHPYVGAFHSNAGAYCSGTLIAPTLVLTAGHCADEMVRGHRFALSPSRSEWVVVPERRRDYHPRYRARTMTGIPPQYDLAIVRLRGAIDSEAPFSAFAAVGALAKVQTGRDGDRVTAVGYGAFCFDRGARPLILGAVRRAAEMILTRVSGVMIWYGESAASPCLGDSGGPVLTKDRRLVGVLSYVTLPCVGAAATRIDTATELAWIRSRISAARRKP